MEIEIAEQLKVTLEKEMQQKFIIFEELTGLKIATVGLRRVHEVGGDYKDPTLKVALKVQVE